MKKKRKLYICVFLFILCVCACLIILRKRYPAQLYQIVPFSHNCTGSTWEITKKPTCTKTGIRTNYCDICNNKIRSETVPKTEHELFEWEIVKGSDCLNKGSAQQKCKICQKVINEKEVEPLGHDYKDCICLRCSDMTYIDTESKTIILSEVNYQENDIKTKEHVVIPETVTYGGDTYTVVGIGYALFYDNKEITSISLPKTVKYIEDHAFDLCENLKTCVLPDGLLSIGEAAFQCCYSLQHITIPDSVTFIGNYAFNHNVSLDNSSFRIPTSIQKMGVYKEYPAHMFYNCGSEDFKEFTLDENEYGYEVIDGILYANNGGTLVSIPMGKTFTDNTYVMPDTVKTIGELSFSRNQHIQKLVISNQLKLDGHMNAQERYSYNNLGNQLSVACYGYTTVDQYIAKEDNPKYTSIEGVLYDKDQSTLVAIPNQYKGVLSIPEGVTKWEYEALWTEVDYFKNMALDKITQIKIPASMTDIDEKQMDTINKIHDYYGTKIIVSADNIHYQTNHGHIVKK